MSAARPPAHHAAAVVATAAFGPPPTSMLPPKQQAEGVVSIELFAQVQELQRALALVPGSPLIALPELAEIILERVAGVDVVG